MLQEDEIKEILKKLNDKNQRHFYYDESAIIAADIAEVFGDEYPSFLKVLRPNETKKDKEYREKVYQNPVKGHLSRITDKHTKIEQSEGFSVNYPTSENGENKLRDYCEKGFNGYGNLINYVFTLGVNKYVQDPNAVLVVLDKNPPQRTTEGYKPYPYIFDSKDVLLFEKGRYCLLREKNTLQTNRDIFYLVDDTNYWIFKQTDKLTQELEFIGGIPHFCGEMPAFKIGLYIEKENSKGEQLFSSVVTNALTDFKKAIARSSDIEIELVHHIHTLEWRMSPKKCKNCKGEKVLTTLNGKIECDVCNGKGVTTWGALDILEVDMFEDKFLQGAKSFPFSSPGGVVQRSIDALKELKSSYNENIDAAYESIDFGVLRKREINTAESGISKQYNRLEYTQKIYSAGRHIVENICLNIYRYIDAQLFGIFNDKNNRIPEITTPVNFDVMSPEMILEEIKSAYESGASKETIAGLEVKYSKLVFGDKSRETLTLIDETNLNPFFGKTFDEILTVYGGGSTSGFSLVSEVDAIIGANFKGFIDRAMREDSKWFERDETFKFEKLKQYANELISNKPSLPTLPVLNNA